MEKLIEVETFEFKELNPKALKEADIDPSIIPVEWIADIYINGENLLNILYGWEK